MDADHLNWAPDWAIAPGAILVETLHDRGMTQAELARRTGRPLKTINEIAKGKAAITADTALQFEAALEVPARFWMNLQRDYDEARARAKQREQLASHSDWVKRFPFAAMAAQKLVRDTRSSGERVEALLNFFGVSSPDAWSQQWEQPAAVFRRSTAHVAKAEPTSVWLRWGQRVAENTATNSFDVEKLKASIGGLRELTLLNPIAFRAKLRVMLAEAGVVTLYLPELPGARVIGATHWHRSRPIVQLSLRHKTDDQFWFALFHECAHVLHGERKRTYVDAVGAPGADEQERSANDFARDVLIPADSYQEFTASGDFSTAAIRKFATHLGIAQGVVLGRLQHDRRVPYGRSEHLKQKIDWLKAT